MNVKVEYDKQTEVFTISFTNMVGKLSFTKNLYEHVSNIHNVDFITEMYSAICYELDQKFNENDLDSIKKQIDNLLR